MVRVTPTTRYAPTMSTTEALKHGLYVGTTGDTTRLKQIRHEAESSSMVAMSWKSVGWSLRRSMGTFKTRSYRSHKSAT